METRPRPTGPAPRRAAVAALTAALLAPLPAGMALAAEPPPRAAPNLIVTVDDGAATATVGETLTQTVTLTNAGGAPAGWARVRLLVPGTTELLSVSDGGVTEPYDGAAAVTWDFLTLEAGQTFTATVSYRVLDRAAAGNGWLGVVAQAFLADAEDADPADNWYRDVTWISRPAPPARAGVWYLPDGPAGNPFAHEGFAFGVGAARVFLGDWDGDGIDTPAYLAGGHLYLRDANSAGEPDLVVPYDGDPADLVVGDWDGDGVDTPGTRAGNRLTLWDAAERPGEGRQFWYGLPDDELLAGDFDGDGRDTLAVRRGNAIHVRNSATSGAADHVFWFGRPGEPILVGDWDGDGRDTVAVRRGSAVHLRNTLASGRASRVVPFAAGAAEVVAGDPAGHGRDTLGAYVADPRP